MLVFLKLGGSLITDKNKPHTPRREVINRLAAEIASARRQNPALQWVLGHGSGSFGHVEGKKYATRSGVRGHEQWLGFAQVWSAARSLNQIVIESLTQAGLPVIAFPPSCCIVASDARISTWEIGPLRSALANGLSPLVYGDVVFDTVRGGTILSTEDLFSHLAHLLKPDRILLAGSEQGVWADFPACTSLIEQITPATYRQMTGHIGDAIATDVTGGMAQKVKSMLDLVKSIPGLQVSIFSGEIPGLVFHALSGSTPGTLLHGEM
ncbi:MAG: isopentenyl phosphate kinase family protein [Anaerolineae bacterium]|nr:isopentenyl phosphate kinase family protein [Anaerolineae bacterium]